MKNLHCDVIHKRCLKFIMTEVEIFPTIFPSSYTSVWTVCVCEQAQLTEVSSQQQIGARSRTSEGVSISLWTTWLGVTSPAPGDWRRKGAIKPPRYYHQPYQTTSPDKMAVRSFPQASIKLSEGNFSRLSDHHHHHQVSSAPDQLTSYILYIYTLLIWMV